jgi:glucosamine--fructose-6-phosphate aminotransferase (isomerizing)
MTISEDNIKQTFSLMTNKFLKEVLEQPAALRKTLSYYLDAEGINSIRKITELIKSGSSEPIILTGMGSSFFIAQTAASILNSSGIFTNAINAGELLHYQFPSLKRGTILIAISQSGESFEIIEILKRIPEGVTVAGISNERDSTLIKKSTVRLLSFAGKEEMTSSKTYVSTGLVTYIMAKTLTGQWNEKEIREVNSLIENIDRFLNNSHNWLQPAADMLIQAPFIQVIGRGPTIASVSQGALMFMEGAGIAAAGIYGGEFRHGPMEMVKEGFCAIMLAPGGATFEQNLGMVKDIAGFGGKVILITNKIIRMNPINILTISVPVTGEDLFMIPAILPLQLLMNQLALMKGRTPGFFTRGAKVTKIE